MEKMFGHDGSSVRRKSKLWIFIAVFALDCRVCGGVVSFIHPIQVLDLLYGCVWNAEG